MKAIRVNLTISGPVDAAVSEFAELTGQSKSAAIAGYLAWQLPHLRAWVAECRGSAGVVGAPEGNPVRVAASVGGLPVSVVEAEGAGAAQAVQAPDAHRLVQRGQGGRDGQEGAKLSRAERRRAEREQRKSGGA